jgi:PTH1 family peptidyl-tRNA hydrolase
MKLIVGLGNYGAKYRFTRHNIGFLALEQLAQRWDVQLSLKGLHSLYGKGVWGGEALLLAQPQTYMNLSGRAVRELAHYFKIASTDIIVIHDDLDFPLGVMRLKIGGGHGGHKGVLSLIAELGTADFMRVRIGIGKPERQEAREGYVLESLPKAALPELLERAAELLESLFSEGIAATMNRFHTD